MTQSISKSQSKLLPSPHHPVIALRDRSMGKRCTFGPFQKERTVLHFEGLVKKSPDSYDFFPVPEYNFFSVDTPWLATATKTGKVTVWNMDTKEIQWSKDLLVLGARDWKMPIVHAKSDSLICYSILPAHRMLSVAIQIFSLKKGLLKGLISTSMSIFKKIKVLGKELMVQSGTEILKWNLRGEALPSIDTSAVDGRSDPVRDFLFYKDKCFLLGANSISVGNINEKIWRHIFLTEDSSITDAVVHNEYMVFGVQNHYFHRAGLCLFNLDNSKYRTVYEPPPELAAHDAEEHCVTSAIAVKDENTFFIGDKNGRVLICKRENTKSRFEFEMLKNVAQEIISLTISGQLLVGLTASKAFSWDLNHLQLMTTVPDLNNSVAPIVVHHQALFVPLRDGVIMFKSSRMRVEEWDEKNEED